MSKGNYLYQQIYKDITDDIRSGKLDIGAQIPTASELAGTYNVSLITANTALNSLKEDGYIERVKGHGNFVISRDIPETDSPAAEQAQESGKGAGTIGVIMEHVSSCFGLDYLYALDEAAHKRGYHILIRFSYGSRQRENEEILYLKQQKVRGFVCMPCHGTYYSTEILRLVLEKVPVVLFDKQMKGIPVSSVRTDNHGAIALLVSWLVSRGRKKIGYVTVDDAYTSSVKARNRGFRESIQRNGLKKMPECMLKTKNKFGIYSDSIDLDEGRQIMEYLDKYPDMDGIIFEEYGFLRQVPLTRSQLLKRIDACCIDEDYMSPGNCYVTHVRQDEKKLAEKTIEVLDAQIRNDSLSDLTDYRVPGLLCTANFPAEKKIKDA
ncbi:MAG: GntR family transcriptional regulator [Lachnospiraceae bacterium]|jgi:DNA-binding LacI/PurR family transcriptional regulator|nr:GntR family transcriptional regulator [Lachnospiraceae bacterium]MCH4031879.1 GntR family transcriptional regulator [Lachnospiraceae bacterium]MCH4070503.1 GntR family transcriptional regulator [Lachnospiraceae bacterium]MCH4109170.1 GntR family transcriptional regulator [Lachnospiraceae bacterium]MCI1303005.1 GntR family transcriptional regulator [Lachnospiraceae bacterium]